MISLWNALAYFARTPSGARESRGMHVFALALGIFVGALGYMPANGQTGSDPRVLSPEQIRSVFVGNTVAGEDEDGYRFDAHLLGDATLKLKYGDTSYTGTWSINQDGKLCGSMEEFFITDTMCFTVEDDGRIPGEERYVLVGDKDTVKVRVYRGDTGADSD